MSSHADTARTDPIPSWVAYSGVGVVGGTALAVLAYYQHRFGADYAQMPAWASWTFSIGLDWGSAVAGIFWFFGAGALARWGRWLAISLVLGSTVLTCIAWGLIAGWWFAPLGIIHPAVAFAMAKLLTLWQADRLARRRTVDGLDAYRADLERERAALEQHHAAALADLESHHAAAAEQLAAEHAALAGRQRLLLQATVAAIAAVSAARPTVTRSTPTAVPPTGGVSPVGGDHHADDVDPMVSDVADFLVQSRKAGKPCGQRPVATAFGVSRAKATELIAAAEKFLTEQNPTPTPTTELPRVNGARFHPIPTTNGATP